MAAHGHLDARLRRVIGKGRVLHHGDRAASHSAARMCGLTAGGLLAPGWRADIVLRDNLETCAVSDVISGGRLVTPELFANRQTVPPVGLASMKAKPITPEAFVTKPRPGENRTPVIGVRPGLILTFREEATLEHSSTGLKPDLANDVIKVAVIERHGINGNIGRSFVTGFGLKRGAIASSVGHDSHNITVIGTNDADMAAAVNRLIEMGGGFAVADGGEILAELALPLAGLMSLEPFESVSRALKRLRDKAHDLGCVLPEPFLQVAFLALPVIPHLKMTDFGLFDVDKFDFVS